MRARRKRACIENIEGMLKERGALPQIHTRWQLLKIC